MNNSRLFKPYKTEYVLLKDLKDFKKNLRKKSISINDVINFLNKYLPNELSSLIDIRYLIDQETSLTNICYFNLTDYITFIEAKVDPEDRHKYSEVIYVPDLDIYLKRFGEYWAYEEDPRFFESFFCVSKKTKTITVDIYE